MLLKFRTRLMAVLFEYKNSNDVSTALDKIEDLIKYELSKEKPNHER